MSTETRGEHPPAAPEGGLVVFNTLTGKKEPFAPIEPPIVRMYNCGPTVYQRPHIGNYRTFLLADVLRRWLEHLGYEVRQVMNVTDVGHLQDDRDDTEDKLQAQAERERTDPWEIARRYEAEFREDLAALGFREAMVYPRATEHIEDMVEIIDGLLEAGYAYRAGENVYFDVHRFERYGRLSGNRVEDLEAGARVAVLEEKRHPADFALWKSDERHLMKWSTHFGPHGYPGWHIECSAMARKHLGDEIDIHTGGEDNIFPHHECEIAQSESFTGRPFARYWMHARFLLIDGGKMSKSLGNVYSLADVAEHGISMRALRYALIRGHYREPLNFTWEIARQCESALESLDDLVARLHRVVEGRGAAADPRAGADELDAARTKFTAGMNDDLNTSVAFAALHELREPVLAGRLGVETAHEALEFLAEAHEVTGVLRLERGSLEDEVEALIEARTRARAEKDWAEADRIRDDLLARGIVLEDTPDGVVWKRRG